MTASKRRKPLRWRGGTVRDGEGVAAVLRREGVEHARVIRKRADLYVWEANSCGQRASGRALSLASAKVHACSWVRRWESGQ